MPPGPPLTHPPSLAPTTSSAWPGRSPGTAPRCCDLRIPHPAPDRRKLPDRRHQPAPDHPEPGPAHSHGRGRTRPRR